MILGCVGCLYVFVCSLIWQKLLWPQCCQTHIHTQVSIVLEFYLIADQKPYLIHKNEFHCSYKTSDSYVKSSMPSQFVNLKELMPIFYKLKRTVSSYALLPVMIRICLWIFVHFNRLGIYRNNRAYTHNVNLNKTVRRESNRWKSVCVIIPNNKSLGNISIHHICITLRHRKTFQLE